MDRDDIYLVEAANASSTDVDLSTNVAVPREIAEAQDFWSWIYSLFAATAQAPTMALDLRLREAWRLVRQTGYDLPSDLEPHREAVKERLRFIRELNRCAKAGSVDDERRLAECEAFLPLTYHPRLPERVETAKRRLAALDVFARLREALLADDQSTAERLAAEPAIAEAAWPGELESLWNQLCERVQRAEQLRERALLDAVIDGDLNRFAELFDRRLVGRIGTQAPHHQRIIGAWVEREILPAERCGLRCNLPHALRYRATGDLQASWTWPAATIADSCRCIVTRSHVGSRTQPDDVAPLVDLCLARGVDGAPSDATIQSVQSEWNDAQVYVWAVVDLGFQTFYSEPIHLGSLQTVNPRKQPETKRRIS